MLTWTCLLLPVEPECRDGDISDSAAVYFARLLASFEIVAVWNLPLGFLL